MSFGRLAVTIEEFLLILFTMDKLLKHLYIKLDHNSQSLMLRAICQIILKIIYSCQSLEVSKEYIVNALKRITEIKRIDSNLIDNALQSLVSNNEVHLKKGYYSLSKSKRDKILDLQLESEKKKLDIIERFFTPCYSESKYVQEWLMDAMITFFEYFSNEWVSNLTTSSRALINARVSIEDIIQKRTNNNKHLEKKDKEVLAKKFFEMITTKDANIDYFIWEFGTSSFAARLISSSLGADTNILDRFKGTVCLLDTNMLIKIALCDEKQKHLFEALESAFIRLGIDVKFLEITHDEYVKAVELKKEEVMRNTCFPISVLQETDDEYIQAACSLHCSSKQDFELFFKQIAEPPKVLFEKLEIMQLNSDKSIKQVIAEAQNDKSKCEDFDNVYFEFHGKHKFINPLKHDVALIEVATYQQKQGNKYLILSQDVVVVHMAKKKPFGQELPIAISLETLINVLAVDNDCRNIDDFVQLFTSIIRNEFTPQHGTFQLTDLTYLQEHNQQVTSLPADMTIKLAQKVNQMRLLGEPEDKIALEFMRGVQADKLQLANDLTEVEHKLFLEREENSRLQARENNMNKKLNKSIRDNAIIKYRTSLTLFVLRYLIVLPCFFVVVSCLINSIFVENTSQGVIWSEICISLFIEMIICKSTNCVTKLKSFFKKKQWIEHQMKELLNKYSE